MSELEVQIRQNSELHAHCALLETNDTTMQEELRIASEREMDARSETDAYRQKFSTIEAELVLMKRNVQAELDEKENLIRAFKEENEALRVQRHDLQCEIGQLAEEVEQLNKPDEQLEADLDASAAAILASRSRSSASEGPDEMPELHARPVGNHVLETEGSVRDLFATTSPSTSALRLSVPVLDSVLATASGIDERPQQQDDIVSAASDSDMMADDKCESLPRSEM